MIRAGFLALGLSLALSAQAAERRVYLVATVKLGGSNLAQSIFLHEPQITDLQGCLDAVHVGKSERNWHLYRHFMRLDMFKGFTGQMHYQCVHSEQRFSVWHDGPRYDRPYLVSVDNDSVLNVTLEPSQAQCMSRLRALPAELMAQSFCSMSNQQLK